MTDAEILWDLFLTVACVIAVASIMNNMGLVPNTKFAKLIDYLSMNVKDHQYDHHPLWVPRGHSHGCSVCDAANNNDAERTKDPEPAQPLPNRRAAVEHTKALQ